MELLGSDEQIDRSTAQLDDDPAASRPDPDLETAREREGANAGLRAESRSVTHDSEMAVGQDEAAPDGWGDQVDVLVGAKGRLDGDSDGLRCRVHASS
jgi:hypothetical protein